MHEEHTHHDDDRQTGTLEETKRPARILKMLAWISNEPRRWTRKRLVAELEYSTRQIDNDLEPKELRHAVAEQARRIAAQHSDEVDEDGVSNFVGDDGNPI